jgi:hypothetical protein
MYLGLELLHRSCNSGPLQQYVKAGKHFEHILTAGGGPEPLSQVAGDGGLHALHLGDVRLMHGQRTHAMQ